jgi:hypothetical protein
MDDYVLPSGDMTSRKIMDWISIELAFIGLGVFGWEFGLDPD